MFSYAMGRGIMGIDRPAIDQMVAQVEKDGDKFSAANTKPGLQPASLSK